MIYSVFNVRSFVVRHFFDDVAHPKQGNGGNYEYKNPRTGPQSREI